MASAEELLDLRRDLGDEAGAFSNEELERLLVRSQRTPTSDPRHYVALAMGMWQLLNQAARFSDYVVNEAQERRGEIWDHLSGSYELLLQRPDVREAVGAGSGDGGGVIRRAMKFTKTLSRRGDDYTRY